MRSSGVPPQKSGKLLVTPSETSIFTMHFSLPSSCLVRSRMIGSGGSFPIFVGSKHCKSFDFKLGLNLVRSKPSNSIALILADLLVAKSALGGNAVSQRIRTLIQDDLEQQ